MTSKETAGREGKGDDGKARTREVKLAVFFTQDKLDSDGCPVRDRDSTSVITSFEPAAAFGKLVRAEGIRRGAGHVRQLTIIGDGAAWIWGIANEKFPEATQVVDLYHARHGCPPTGGCLRFTRPVHNCFEFAESGCATGAVTVARADLRLISAVAIGELRRPPGTVIGMVELRYSRRCHRHYLAAGRRNECELPGSRDNDSLRRFAAGKPGVPDRLGGL